MSRSMRVVLRNRLSEIPRLAEATQAFAAANDLPPDVVFKLDLAFDELITNIVSYAHPKGGDHEIIVQLDREGDELCARIEDDGVPFDPLAEAAEPDTSAGVDERPIGGLGVHLVKAFMDSVEYRRIDDRNHLVMRKRLAG